MSRIGETFARLQQERRAALIPYLTAGDPSASATVRLMHGMVEAGADLLEVGVPFSDPMADGPVIQRAAERALARGMSLAGVLDVVREFRAADGKTPVVLMGYLNPVEAMGYAEFAARAAAAGADGVIIVDVPPEEGGDLNAALVAHGIDPVFLLAPTSSDERTDLICGTARGFIYYVSLRGVTGAANLDLGEVEARIRAIKKHTELPVGVGFGISDAETAAQVARFADAVIVGSAVVRRIEESGDDLAGLDSELRDFISGLRRALNGRTGAALEAS